jgi:GDP-4-dehydro-6-deoxy-D-mannose reductase
MILYNGENGSLGRYLAGALTTARVAGRALKARLEDAAGLDAELASIEIDRPMPVCLVQMAARVSVPECERDPDTAHRINVESTARTVHDFIAWAKARGHAPSVIYVSSGHIYAASPSRARIRESDPLAPRSVYAKTKAAAEAALHGVARELGAPLVVARVFGLIAPAQPPHYVLPGLIRRGQNLELSSVPGADGVRDYLDARDVASVLVELARRLARAESVPETLNVCSGQGVTIRAVLEEVLRALGAQSNASITAAPGRPDDIPYIVGDPSALERLIGRAARQIGLEETVRDALVCSRA